MAQDGSQCAPGAAECVKDGEKSSESFFKFLKGKFYIIRKFFEHEGSDDRPDVRRPVARDGDRARTGSGLHRQSDQRQHEERR